VVSQKIHHFLIDNLNTAVLLLDDNLTIEYINAESMLENTAVNLPLVYYSE
jgi:nitrogen-specific signal transduction histidine kinase